MEYKVVSLQVPTLGMVLEPQLGTLNVMGTLLFKERDKRFGMNDSDEFTISRSSWTPEKKDHV